MNPTQYEINSITIKGEDVIGLFSSLSIYEDIYIPCITGSITICDSQGAVEGGSFIEEKRIQFIEEFEFSFKSASEETLEFKGYLNGLRDEFMQDAVKFYTINFYSESVRENEKQFVAKSYRDSKPEDIVQEMVEKLKAKVEIKAKGRQMQYLGSRKRPVDIIKYVLTHSIEEGKDAPNAPDTEEQKEEESSGTTGFLCWETLDGYVFDSVNNVTAGKSGQKHKDFKLQSANQNLSKDEVNKLVVQCQFSQIGDFQTKLRSGAFGAKNISFDMDKGTYKEYEYYNEKNMTEELKRMFPPGSISRIFNRPIDNQKFNNTCEPAKELTGDQSRAYLQMNAGRQNTFSDQTGFFTLYPQFKFRAGDSFEVELSKYKGEKADGGYDKKHSGKYIIQSVGHHFFAADAKAYTKIKTIRSTIQQDDASSNKS